MYSKKKRIKSIFFSWGRLRWGRRVSRRAGTQKSFCMEDFKHDARRVVPTISFPTFFRQIGLASFFLNTFRISFSKNLKKVKKNVNRNGTFDCSLAGTSGALDKTDLKYTTSTETSGSPTFDANTADAPDGENIVGIKSGSLGTEANRLNLVFNFEKPVTIGTEGVVLAVKGIHPSITQGGTFAGVAKITLNSVPVPEPSMFGVLAGLGALALVGVRRRRRK